MEIEKFNPTKAEIQATVLEVEGLTISGVDDVAGYEAVKTGKKRLADYRIAVTKFGKNARQGLLEAQRSIIRQEKELLEMITPTENRLKAEMEKIDEQVKRAERVALLPSRRAMLEDINVGITDDEILDMDVDKFSKFYTEKQMEFYQRQEEKKKALELEAKHKEELEAAKKEAAENAKREAEEKAERDKQIAAEKAEKDKQDAIDKIKRDQAEKERKEKEALEQAIKDEEARLEKERKEQERAEKNKKYKNWLDENGFTEELRQKGEFHVLRDGDTFTLYKKVSEITI